MAIRCKNCGREYDVTLFQFGRTVQCDCGNEVTLEGVQQLRDDGRPTRLILVRHGETDWNAQARLQGHQPVSLNARGRHTAQLLARRIAKERPQNLYSSDLPRALETAEAIAEATGLEIVQTDRLREGSYGEWEGKTWDELKAERAGEFQSWVAADFLKAPPGRESETELRERTIAFLADVLETHSRQTSVLVTHIGPCKYAIAHTLGIGPDGVYRYSIDNGSIHIIEYGAFGARLALLNDTCHLRGDAHRAAPGDSARTQ